jgi:ubiquinone/menaquinone biosynthesis C-methylase UbiE
MNAIVERYDRDAADYERYWAPVLERTALRLLDFVDDYVRWVERVRGRVRLLEVGVGTGSLVRAALARWPSVEVIATDAARGMAELARERVSADPDSALGSRVSWLTAPADQLPVPDASVDLLLSTFVLQLVPDRASALREARRALAPGGRVAYLTWLDRDVRRPFLPGEEFDEAVYDLDIDEPEWPEEPHAGDVRSGRAAAAELRRAGFVNATAREELLEYQWTADSYLQYKLAYDESALLSVLSEEQQTRLEHIARERLSRLEPTDFRWHAPVVFARADRPR